MPAKPYVHRVHFPVEFQKALINKETDQAGLVRSMERKGHRITKQFLNDLARGHKRVPGFQLQKICETLQLDEFERRRLHWAAALDAGFNLGPIP